MMKYRSLKGGCMKKILMILGIGLFACLLTLSSRAIMSPVSSVKGTVMVSATHDSAAVLPAPRP